MIILIPKTDPLSLKLLVSCLACLKATFMSDCRNLTSKCRLGLFWPRMGTEPGKKRYLQAEQLPCLTVTAGSLFVDISKQWWMPGCVAWMAKLWGPPASAFLQHLCLTIINGPVPHSKAPSLTKCGDLVCHFSSLKGVTHCQTTVSMYIAV